MAERKLRPQALAHAVDEDRLVHNLRALRRRQHERALGRKRQVHALAGLAACALLALLGRPLWAGTKEPTALRATSPMGLERLSAAPPQLAAGAPAALAPGPVPSVLERADALRAARDPKGAAQLLSAELDRSPDSEEAGLIALVLGQIELDELHQAASAAQRFERAERSPALPAALREQAPARKVQALLRANDIAEAQRCAEAYAARYPHGSWHKAVRSWLEGARR